MIDYADDTGWRQLKEAHPVARKEHRCGECQRIIAPGERYWTVSAISDYGLDYYKMCAHCEAATSWLSRVCGGFLFYGVEEDLAEHWIESPEYRSHWLGRALLGLRAKWRRPDGTLRPVPARFTGPLPHDR